MTDTGRVVVECADLFEWLPRMAGRGAVVAVLPDADEVGLGLDAWRAWFVDAARACFAASTGPTVFMQTDRMAAGRWVSKPALLAEAAPPGAHLLWHKVALRREPGKVDLHRPTYSHVIAYGPGRPGARTPDVIQRGAMRWPNAMGEAVASMVAVYLEQQGARAVVNPCCGHGTVLAAAAALGIDAYGCDLDPGRAAIAATIERELRE